MTKKDDGHDMMPVDFSDLSPEKLHELFKTRGLQFDVRSRHPAVQTILQEVQPGDVGVDYDKQFDKDVKGDFDKGFDRDKPA